MFKLENQFPPYDLGTRWYKVSIEKVSGSFVITDADMPFYNEGAYPSAPIKGMAAFSVYSGTAFAFSNAKIYDVITDIDDQDYLTTHNLQCPPFTMDRVSYQNYNGSAMCTIGLPGSPSDYVSKFAIYVLAKCVDKDADFDPDEI